MNVGFIGLGAMGYPMAGCLPAHFPTTVWNRTTAVADAHAAETGSRAGSLAEAVTADVVVSCLKTSAVVQDVVVEAAPALRPGTVWIDSTSGDLARSRAVAAMLAERGVHYLDAPVSGMAKAARTGSLTFLVGGEAADLARARPVLDAMGATVLHLGGPGAGHLTKAANNALFATSYWAASEALALLAGHGITPAAALKAFNACSGRSDATDRFLPTYVFGNETTSSFALGDLTKDITNLVRDGGAVEAALLAEIGRRYAGLAERLGARATAHETYAAMAGSASRNSDGVAEVVS